MHAQILLKRDQGPEGPRWTEKQVSEAFGIGETVQKVVRKRFVENRLEDALNRREQQKRPEKQKIDGEQEAQIIAMLYTEHPEGQERWTLRAIGIK